MTVDVSCLFCRIVAGEIPATVVRETELTLAFRDVNPQAPTHVLVIPKEHLPNIATLSGHGAELLGAVTAEAVAVAEAEGIAATGWRLVMNTGTHGGQSVDHIHMHVLGGRQLAWPPG